MWTRPTIWVCPLFPTAPWFDMSFLDLEAKRMTCHNCHASKSRENHYKQLPSKVLHRCHPQSLFFLLSHSSILFCLINNVFSSFFPFLLFCFLYFLLFSIGLGPGTGPGPGPGPSSDPHSPSLKLVPLILEFWEKKCHSSDFKTQNSLTCGRKLNQKKTHKNESK